MKQVQEAYIVAATRSPIGKSHRGFFRNTRPDDLLVKVLQSALAQVPGLDTSAIGWPAGERGWHHGEPVLCFRSERDPDGGRPHTCRRG